MPHVTVLFTLFTQTSLYLIPCTGGSLNHSLLQNGREAKAKSRIRGSDVTVKLGNQFMTPGSVRKLKSDKKKEY